MSHRSFPPLTFGGSLVPGHARARALQVATLLPESADVVVIGGGIIGAATAFFLAERGVSVALCEKGAIAGEASGRSLGQVASAGLAPVKLELLIEAKRLWRDMSERVGGETGYRMNGYLAPLLDEPSRQMFETWLDEARTFEPEARILGSEEVKRHAPGLAANTSAYYNPTDGTAEPTLATSAFAEGAARKGARILTNCAARGLDIAGGRIAGVITEHGRIRASSVVLAGGCWSRLFAGAMGIELPLLNVHAFCESVYDVDAGPVGSVDAPGASWRRQIDGGYTLCVIGGHVPIVPAVLRYAFRYLSLMRTVHWDLELSLGKTFLQELATPSTWSLDAISPFERRRILEPQLSAKFIRLAREKVMAFQPAFRGMRAGESWSGALCTPPDNSPTMSAVRSRPGLFLATGFSYGLTMAPAAGRLMADLVTGGQPAIDPTPYRYERYLDGTRLEPLA